MKIVEHHPSIPSLGNDENNAIENKSPVRRSLA